MALAEFKIQRSRREENDVLASALVLSLILHVAFYFCWEIGRRVDPGKSALLDWMKKLDPSRLIVKPKPREEIYQQRAMNFTFAEVNPNAVSEKAPKDAKYYGAKSSLAANPDPSDKSHQAKIDGKQDRTIKVVDVPRERSPAPAPASKPTAPTPPKQPESKPAPKTESKRTPEQPPKTTPKSESKPEPKPILPLKPTPRPVPKPPSVKMAKAKTPFPPLKPPQPRQPKVEKMKAVPPPPEQPKVEPPRAIAPAKPLIPIQKPAPKTSQEQPRPRTLSEARARSAAAKMLVGERMRQDGGVQRRGVASLDVMGTSFGGYDASLTHAIQQKWFQLMGGRSTPRGHAIIKFRQHHDGRVTNVEVVESNVGEILTVFCQMAISEPSPYARWPSDMRRQFQQDYRDVTFTFHY